MAKPHPLDIDELRQLYDYNPNTGEVTSKQNGMPVGRIKNSRGIDYLIVDLGNRRYTFLHRVIYAVVTGNQPPEIDHLDGDGLNNKWDNLRPADRSVNMRNKAVAITNTSGVTGVTWSNQNKKWRAEIGIGNRKRKLLGYFDNKEDAIAARKEAEQELGYNTR